MVAPLLMDGGEVVAPLLTDVGAVLALTDEVDPAWTEDCPATRPSPLLAVLQQVLVVPLTEQQKSPSLTAEP